MNLKARKYFFISFAIILSIILIARLAQLQIVEQKEYGKESQKNSIKKIVETPARGLIIDRTGKVLVDNKPSYTLTITPYNFDKSLLEEVANLSISDGGI